MNRLESLQLYPVQYRKIFYLGAPTVFIFFALAILVSCFGLSFQEAQDYWYIPGLVGGAFSWYAFHNVVVPNEDQDAAASKTDIEADPRILKEELEKANRFIPQIIKYLMGILGITVLLRPPFFREIGQVADLLAMSCFLAIGAYFRQVLHVYSRTPGVPDEEIGGRLAERSLFQFLGWAAIGFFFLKTLGLKGKMGDSWSGLPNFQFSPLLLWAALGVYLLGILGVFFLIFKERAEDRLSGLFNSCIAFGSTFPLIWLYSYLHPYLFTDIPAWLIQVPGLVLVLVNSVGIYLSFQSGLKEKILGNSCLWFVRYGQQVLGFVFFWAVAVLYIDMNPVV
ncbi:MAG: hypothetical protein ACRDFB_00665, partial [Rhabdochlamydiaceae bacterium]